MKKLIVIFCFCIFCCACASKNSKLDSESKMDITANKEYSCDSAILTETDRFSKNILMSTRPIFIGDTNSGGFMFFGGKDTSSLHFFFSSPKLHCVTKNAGIEVLCDNDSSFVCMNHSDFNCDGVVSVNLSGNNLSLENITKNLTLFKNNKIVALRIETKNDLREVNLTEAQSLLMNKYLLCLLRKL